MIRSMRSGRGQMKPEQLEIERPKLLGDRPDRAAARSDKIDRLPIIVVRKRSSVTSFHPTPPGSSSLLQVSINSVASTSVPCRSGQRLQRFRQYGASKNDKTYTHDVSGIGPTKQQSGNRKGDDVFDVR
jgi:hypothetical protein